ncbi:ribonuclease H-like domain-containing protein [Tanacetum coccineum]
MMLMQFLIGLDDTYMQIRSSILLRETLPDVKSAYAIISSKESHMVASGSISGTSQRSQTSTFTANVPNRGNFQRLPTSVMNGKSPFDLIVCSRDVKFFEDIFPFKQISDKSSEQFIQDLNHLNFFNSDYLDDLPDMPNDGERRDPIPTRYGTPPPHSGSTFESLNENEGVHSQGPNATASEGERFANHEDVQNNVVYEGDESLIHLQASKHQPCVDVMNSEMDALYRNKTWELADLPNGRKAIVLETPSGICLNQRKYCLKLIDAFGLLASKPAYIPMQPNISLSSEPKDDDHMLENITDYQKLIGKLIYLTITRPDITYTVSCLSQFMHSPLKTHLIITLKVIMYLKGSPSKGINVIKGFASGIDLKTYTNAD